MITGRSLYHFRIVFQTPNEFGVFQTLKAGVLAKSMDHAIAQVRKSYPKAELIEVGAIGEVNMWPSEMEL